MFSLIILAYNLGGANTAVAVTLLSYTLPALFLPPFAGVYADRHNRQRTMVWANLGRAAIVTLIPLSQLTPFLRGDIYHLPGITLPFRPRGQIKHDPRLSDTPIIAMTAWGLARDEERARLAGCDDYLAKPFENETLIATVARYVR